VRRRRRRRRVEIVLRGPAVEWHHRNSHDRVTARDAQRIPGTARVPRDRIEPQRKSGVANSLRLTAREGDLRIERAGRRARRIVARRREKGDRSKGNDLKDEAGVHDDSPGQAGTWIPHVTVPCMAAHAVLTHVTNQPGMLFGLSKVLAGHQANITHVDIMERDSGEAQIYLEFVTEQPLPVVLEDLRLVPGVQGAESMPSFAKIYGKRIIIMGGGAQVGQVALGAITEADRHNIRGERISVDTIPLVGEDALAAAVRAVVRLPRVRLLVLAGSLMGGDISKAVDEVRQQGLVVISLNMAGSVPDMADLVVSDPVQAGVMAVMAIADTAKFDIVRQQKRRY